MRKTVFVVLGLLAVVVYGIAISTASDTEVMEGEAMQVPLGAFELSPPDSVEAKRASVDFPHSQHFAINCMTCHHQWAGDEPVQGCMTSGCHDLDVTPEKDSGDDPVMYYKNAYHDQCIGCHKAIKAHNKQISMAMGGKQERIKPTGPTSCNSCHPKE